MALALLSEPFLWDCDLDTLAEHLVGGVPVRTGSSIIPSCDDAGYGFGDDSVR